MPVARWEDLIPRWGDEGRAGEVVGHHPTITHGPLAVGLWAAPAPAPSAGAAGSGAHDLLVASWDACFEGGVYRFPRLTAALDVDGPGERIPDVFGNVDAVPGIAPPALVGVTRGRPEVLLFSDVEGAPPASLGVRIQWVRGPETLHVVRVCDLDGDGVWDLLIGTDDWSDYWPDGREWNDAAYRPYEADGTWRGGPLRGHVYFAHNDATPGRPRFEPAVPLVAGGRPLEVYGTAAPAWGDFSGRGAPDLICGDFLDRLWFFRHRGGVAFDPSAAVLGPDGRELTLPQNIHVPVAVPGAAVKNERAARAPALLVGAEDGLVHRLDPLSSASGVPAYSAARPIRQPQPPLHAGILPVPTVCDWANAGRLDLIVGTGGGWLLRYPDLGGDPLRRYGEPVTLRTDSGPIRVQAGLGGSIQGPSEAKWGYLCPTAADWDADGRPEVLASDVMGRHLLFARTPDPAVLEPPCELHYGGAPLRTAWRVRPAVTNWGSDSARWYVCVDADGLLADFAQVGRDTLERKRVLRYADGTPVAFTEDRGGGLGRVKLAVCDWTGSRNGDLLVGTHARASVPPGPAGAPRHTHGQATVLILENVGTPGHPAFARPRQLCYRGAPLRYGMHACSPEPVDWFRRGTLDLVVGAESGTLLVLRREWLSW